MKPLNTLSLSDVEVLRRKPLYGTCSYYLSKEELDTACAYLESLYKCKVRKSFTAKVLILNELSK